MAQNKGKSQKLLTTMARVNFLLQEGFSRSKIANMADMQYGTLQKIAIGHSNDITKPNYEKIKKIHLDYINQKSEIMLKDEEPVIDSQDAEEGAREVAVWITIIVLIGLLALIGLAFIVRYIIGLL
jgi:transcriptional regulator with XRE-family HTH domain